MSSAVGDISEKNILELWKQLLQECEAMAEYAFSTGLKVPSHMMEVLEEIDRKRNSTSSEDNMVILDNVEQLTVLHNKLAELIAPARPRTVLLMSQETKKKSLFLFLGNVPLIRYMMLMAVLSLVLLIFFCMSPDVNNVNIVKTLLNSSGDMLVLVQLVLIAAAALGASFNALFTANKYVVAGTYDPKYDSSYWVRFVVGVISGVILTQVIEIKIPEGADSGGFSKIGLALIGGFSSNLVYKILDRLSTTVESFVSGGSERKVSDAKREAQLIIDENINKTKSRLTKQLIQMQQQLNNSNELDKEEIKRLFDQQLNQLMDDDQASKVA